MTHFVTFRKCPRHCDFCCRIIRSGLIQEGKLTYTVCSYFVLNTNFSNKSTNLRYVTMKDSALSRSQWYQETLRNLSNPIAEANRGISSPDCKPSKNAHAPCLHPVRTRCTFDTSTHSPNKPVKPWSNVKQVISLRTENV